MATPWTPEEESTLQQIYNLPYIEIMEIIWGRSESQIKKKMVELGLKREPKSIKYSPQEDEIIIEKYPYASWDELLGLLIGRNKRSISQRAAKLGVLRSGSEDRDEIY